MLKVGDKQGDKQGDICDVTFSVVDLVRKGKSQKDISKILGLNERTIKRHYHILKTLNIIKLVGYGTWNVSNDLSKLDIPRRGHLNKDNPPGHSTNPPPPPVSDCSLHDLVFTVQIPSRFPGWNNRGHHLKAHFSDSFKNWTLADGSSAFLVSFSGYVVITYSKCLVLHIPRAFVSSDYKSCKLIAESFAKDILRAFFRKICLFLNDRSLQVSYTDREHYARFNDPISRDFHKKRLKVRVPFVDRGHFVFDFSDHVNHAEVQNSGGDFIDVSWKPFIQDWEKNHPGITLSQILLLSAAQTLVNKGIMDRCKLLENRVFDTDS